MFVATNSLLTTPVNPGDIDKNIFGFQPEANLQEGPHDAKPKFKSINFKIKPSKKHKRDWEIMLEDFCQQRQTVVHQLQVKGYEEDFKEHFNHQKFSSFEQLGDAVFGECTLFKQLYTG